MKYFIGADDFGWNANLNEAIDMALCKGWVQRASLMVNAYGFSEAVRLAKEHGYADRISFHLNLAEETPLTEEIKRTVFTYNADKGKFCRMSNKGMQVRCMSHAVVKAIRTESEAQMRRFRDSGFTSTRIDSHRWCMFNLPVWHAIEPLLKQYGFTTPRARRRVT